MASLGIYFEGPQGRPEGVKESRLKFLAIGKVSLVPSVHPNLRVLGEAWSSYGRAKPTQNNPRNMLG